MDQFSSIPEILGVMRRRWLLLVLVGGFGILGTMLFALSRPSYYETSATILVESQQISDELARSTVNLSATARLQMIQQRLMARDSLVATIEKLGLFADSPGLKMATKVELLRKSATIQSISSASEGWNGDDGLFAFTITVRFGDPDQAAMLVNEFVEKAIAQNVALRAERVQDTLAYFDAEDERVGRMLADVDLQITAFKKANEDALPENLESARSARTRLEDTGRDIERRLLELEEKDAELATALAAGRSGGLDGGGPSPEESELSRLQLELAQKRRVLAPTHPEVRKLEQQVSAVTALLAPKPRPAQGAADGLGEDRRAATERQIEQLRAQAVQLRAQQAEVTRQRQDIDRSIRRTPEVQLSLGALERRQRELQEQYSDVARRRADARTGEQLEANNQSERFEVVENALVPDQPVGPNRKKLVVFGSGASLGLAFGLAMLIELLNPALRSSAQMERQLNLRPVVAIPYVPVPGEYRRRLIVRFAVAATVAAGVWLAVPIIDRHVIPLQPLVAKLTGQAAPVLEHGSGDADLPAG